MVGFVFFAKSPRYVGFEAARALGAQARGRARIVALSVDADDDALALIVEALAPDILQLHGRESPARVKEIGRRFGRATMKAIGVAAPEDLAAAEAYDGVADFLLIDAKPPKDAALPGGNGLPFDWRLARGFSSADALAAVGRPRSGQCRRGDRADGRARRRRLLGRRERAGASRTKRRSRPSSPPRARPSPARPKEPIE